MIARESLQEKKISSKLKYLLFIVLRQFSSSRKESLFKTLL